MHAAPQPAALTDEQIWELWQVRGQGPIDFARAVLAAAQPAALTDEQIGKIMGIDYGDPNWHAMYAKAKALLAAAGAKS
jgi:hypothetical protein